MLTKVSKVHRFGLLTAELIFVVMGAASFVMPESSIDSVSAVGTDTPITLSVTATPSPTETVTACPTLVTPPAGTGGTPDTYLLSIALLVIGIGIGFAAGFIAAKILTKPKGKLPPPVPTYLDVIRVLIGATGTSPDYLGEMVKAMILNRRHPGENIPDRTTLLQLQESLLRQLERTFGLRSVPLSQNTQGNWIEPFDDQKHLSTDIHTPKPGELVYVRDPGWEARRWDTRETVILKKASVQKRERNA